MTDEDFHYVSDEEFQQALSKALADLNLTFDDLQRQADADDFASEKARWLWDAVGDLSAA
jgi:hypothetical protein